MNPFFPRHHMVFMGGGGGAQAISSAPVPTPAPPVTANSAEVIQAEQDTAQQNLIKKSVKNTILAGDTGGWMAGANPQGGPGMPPPGGFKSKLG